MLESLEKMLAKGVDNALLRFGLGTDTRVNIDYYHMESNDLPDSGIPYGYSVGKTHTAARPDRPRPCN